VRVCVYWKDVLLGMAEQFERHGYECVSAGHIYDAEFLPRLAGLLNASAGVFTNEVGSHVLYATLLDRPVVIQRQEIMYSASSEEIVRTDVPRYRDHPNVVRLVELFATLGDRVTTEQRRFVEELSGATETKSRTELRAILTEAEDRYRETTSFPRRAIDRARSELYCQLLRRVGRDRV
jgi:hypothetical protein